MPRTRRSACVKPHVFGSSTSKPGSLMSIRRPSSAIASSPAPARPAVPWSKLSITAPTASRRWITPLSRSDTKNCRLGSVEHDGAEAGAAVAGDGREQGDCPSPTVDAIDAAGPAALVGAELAGHPLRVGLSLLQAIRTAVTVGIGADDLQAERRGLADVDVRRQGIVEGDGKHLAHIARAQLEGRLRGNDLALRRCAGRAQLEDLRRGSVEIDVEHVERVGARRHRSVRRLDAGRSP